MAREALAIGNRLDNLELKSFGAYRLAEFTRRLKRYNVALQWLSESEVWCTRMSYQRGIAWIMYSRGTTYLAKGNPGIAESFLSCSFQMATEWGERSLIASDDYQLALVLEKLGRIALALGRAQEAADLFEWLGWTAQQQEAQSLVQRLMKRRH